MEKYWGENIHRTIEGFANFERQRSSWCGINTQIVSSYIEDYNLLFYSFDFEDFIETSKDNSFDAKILEELIHFKNVLVDYDNSISEEMQLNDLKILEDFNWQKVVHQAKRIMELWTLE